VLRILRTFALVCLAWVFFRAENVAQGMTIVVKVASGLLQPSFYMELVALMQHSTPFWMLTVFIAIEWFNKKSWNTLSLASKPLPLRWAAYTALFWIILLYGTEQTETFIYFRF
jgi:hypothetical protein